MKREASLAILGVLGLIACAEAQQQTPPADDAARIEESAPQGLRAKNTLSWEELSVRLVGRETSAGLQIDVTTLDADAIELAAPDIQAHLADLKKRIPEQAGFTPEEVDEMTALLVAFTGFEKEISFDPTRLIMLSEGSTFYPLHVLPVSQTFERRLVGLYETVYGLYLFEPGIDFFANLEFRYAELSSNAQWLGLVEEVQRAKARREASGVR